MLAMVQEKVLVAFFRPNGITFHSYKLDLVIIAIFFTSLGAIKICQNLDCKFIVNQVLKTIVNALIDSKYLQLGEWGRNPILFENLWVVISTKFPTTIFLDWRSHPTNML
jgi:hypothetical protein